MGDYDEDSEADVVSAASEASVPTSSAGSPVKKHDALAELKVELDELKATLMPLPSLTL